MYTNDNNNDRICFSAFNTSDFRSKYNGKYHIKQYYYDLYAFKLFLLCGS